MSPTRIRLVVALAAALPLIAGTASAQGSSAAPGPRTLEIGRTSGQIRIDGSLDDEGWIGATRTRGWTELQPQEGAPAPVETEVVIAYDDGHVYVGFEAHDPSPREIRGSLRQRDQMWQEDLVAVLLDTYGESALGQIFATNSYGVQGDIQLTPQGEDPSIDYVFQSAATRTGSGYIVEMAIPFGSLRFPDRPVQSWRINFFRNYPRTSRHVLFWSPVSLNNPCMLCQAAHLAGIEGVQAGGTLEVLPALVGAYAGHLADRTDPRSFQNDPGRVDASLGLKYSFQRGWTAEATLNPDFSQVESDAAQVDVNTTFALSYPERRPFFQEGTDIFDTPVNVFYSRSINDPSFATKMTGREGGLTIGYIGARDERTPFILPFAERSVIAQGGTGYTNVLRLRRNLFDDSHVGGLLTDRRLEEGGSGTTAGIDLALRLREVYRIEGQVVVSHTREPGAGERIGSIPELTFSHRDRRYTAALDGESFTGMARALEISRSARSWSWNVDYTDALPTYRADVGFQTRNDFRRLYARSSLASHPNRHGLERISAGIGVGSIWSFDGDSRERWVDPGLSLTLPHQTNVNVNAAFRRETFRGVELEGVRRWSVSLNSNFSDAVSIRFGAAMGRFVARTLATPEVGDGLDAWASAALKPFDRVVLEPSIDFSSLERDFGGTVYSGYVGRVRVNYQFNRELQLRTIFQYNDFSGRVDVEPLLVYRLNPFSIFYLGSTHAARRFDGLGLERTDRQLFAKFQYLIRADV